MKIMHRLVFEGKDNVEELLSSNTINFKKRKFGANRYIIIIEISESNPAWNLIHEVYLSKGHNLDVVDTVFTKEEIAEADWLRMVPIYEQGYPQPINDWRRITYGNTVCPKCGIGYHQIAPFRLAKEPSLGNYNFFHTFWENSVFCTSEVVTVLRESGITGIEVWDAIIHHKNRPSDVVSQLIFPYIAQPGLAEIDKVNPWKCKLCGITKYAYHRRGYMHIKKESLNSYIDAQLTDEWFGSDTFTGHREILISKRFAKIILINNWSGVILKPVILD